MTDYLDLLLEQAEDDGDEQPLVWRRTARIPPAVQENREENAARQVDHEAETDLQVKRKNLMEPENARNTGNPETDVLEQIRRLKRAGDRVRNGRAVSVGGHYTAGTEATSPARLATTSELGAPGMPTVRLAAVLDAAFERDARRYDGPLGLL